MWHMTQTPPHRVGLVGYSASREFHVPPILAAGGEITAVVTRNPERMAAVREDLPAAAVVPDLAALLERDDVDLVVLATPTGLHVEQAHQVIDAGLPLVVDKPLAPHAGDARAVADHARAAGVPLTAYHNRRWDAEHQLFRTVLGQDLLGPVYEVDLTWTQWRPEPPQRWRETLPSTEGGGVLLDIGTHLVDLALDLLGPGHVVLADLAERFSASDDDVRLVIRHDSGTLTRIHASKACPLTGRSITAIGRRAAYLQRWDGSGDVLDTTAPAQVVVGDEVREVHEVAEPLVPFYEQVFAALASDDPQAGMPVQPEDVVAVADIIEEVREQAPN